MPDNLLDRIKDEINKSGFPLEFRVARVLKDRGYYVAHSLYYVDQEEGKSREADLRALYNFEIKNNSHKDLKFFRNCFFIECKKSDKNPWVFLSSERNGYEPSWHSLLSIIDMKMFNYSDFREFDELHPFESFRRVARSYFEACKGKPETGETIFKALTSAVKSCLYFKESGFLEGEPGYFYPIIVFDGHIFEGHLEDGEMKVAEVDSVLVSFDYITKNHGKGFLIPVVKESALDDFLDQMEKMFDYMGGVIRQRLPE